MHRNDGGDRYIGLPDLRSVDIIFEMVYVIVLSRLITIPVKFALLENIRIIPIPCTTTI